MDILLSRQPIFDRDEKIAGYELSYTGNCTDDAVAAGDAHGVVVEAVLDIGLDRVTDGKTAFLDVSREMVESGAVELLDPSRVILELSGVREVDGSFVAACERLRSRGYRLALDAASAIDGAAGLLPHCEIVRVDVQAHGGPELAEVAGRLRAHPVRLLAENVQNLAVRDACLRAGFELFQGFEFSRPEVLAKRDLPVDYLRTAMLMQQIRDLDVTDARIEEEFRTDLSLTYKLLRMVNSASVGGRGVQSIGHAIRLLGRETIYRWLALLLLHTAADTGVKAEIVHTSLLRARLCELLAPLIRRGADAGSFYIVGLMSLLDVLLGTPMDELIANTGLTPEVQRALLDRSGLHGEVLRLVEAYDLGHWDEFTGRCEELGLSPNDVGTRYLEALSWASERTIGFDED
jgi:EAL and modified HD-GYP domain-containing signal transduction protein